MLRRIDPAYLKRMAETPAVNRIKTRALESLEVAAGDRVLDVGCGPAIDTIKIARLVGPTGHVVGVDGDPAMVVEANRTAVSEGVGAFTRHIVGDAAALALGSNEFDACFCERVLQHMPWTDAGKAANEMIRVVRPGGRVVVVDTDWASLSVAVTDPWLERRMVQEHAWRFPNPFSGRYLLLTFRPAGLADMIVETFSLQLSFDAVEFLFESVITDGLAVGRISAGDARRWYSELGAARDYGVFFAHVSIVVLAGIKK